MKISAKQLLNSGLILVLCVALPGCAGGRVRNLLSWNPGKDFKSLEELEAEDRKNAADDKQLAATSKADEQSDTESLTATERLTFSERVAALSPFGRKESSTNDKDDKVVAKADSSAGDASGSDGTSSKQDKPAGRLLALGKFGQKLEEDPFLARSGKTSDEEETLESESSGESGSLARSVSLGKELDEFSKTAFDEKPSASELDDALAELSGSGGAPGSDSASESWRELEELVGNTDETIDNNGKHSGSDPVSELESLLASEGIAEEQVEDADIASETEAGETESDPFSEFVNTASGTHNIARKRTESAATTMRDSALNAEKTATNHFADLFGTFDDDGKQTDSEHSPGSKSNSPGGRSRQLADSSVKAAQSFDSLFGAEKQLPGPQQNDEQSIAAEDDPFAAAAGVVSSTVERETGFGWKSTSEQIQRVAKTVDKAERWWDDAEKEPATAEEKLIRGEVDPSRGLNVSRPPQSDPFYNTEPAAAEHRLVSGRTAATSMLSSNTLTVPPIRVVSATMTESAAPTAESQSDPFYIPEVSNSATDAEDSESASVDSLEAEAKTADVSILQRLRLLSFKTWVMVLGSIIVAFLLFAPGRRKTISAAP